MGRKRSPRLEGSGGHLQEPKDPHDVDHNGQDGLRTQPAGAHWADDHAPT